MSLSPGTRLGPYEVVALLGAGGMGEVYRARDTRLDRTVALKVLPQRISSTTMARERFEREARAISALNHPNICTLFDVGSHDGTEFLVMELVDGEALKGPLPPDDVLRIGAAIADALARAHRSGIIHRDLKPANILLTKSGPKLLDFGLARKAEEAQKHDATTVIGQAITTEGTILGTLPYMAPEQLEGKPADARTDIFALGAVLYELITGKRAFDAQSQASLITRIMSAQPAPIAELQPVAPAALNRVVMKCLAKDPDDRWQAAADVATELRWIAEGSLPESAAKKRAVVPWIAAALFAIVALLAFATRRAAESPRTIRFNINPPGDNGHIAVGDPTSRAIAVSPDGSQIVFTANDGHGWKLWLRRLDRDAVPLDGGENGFSPFWSPDGRNIGFFAGGKLKVASLESPGVQSVCDATGNGLSAAWMADGTIVFNQFVTMKGLWTVPASGGTPRQLIRPDPDTFDLVGPRPIGNTRSFFFTAIKLDRTVLMIGDLDGHAHKLLDNAGRAVYDPPFVVYARDGTLFAQRFDERKLALDGAAVPIADGVWFYRSIGSSQADTDGGTLVYGVFAYWNTVTWIDANGKPLGEALPPGAYRYQFRISPDGRKVIVAVNNLHTMNGDLVIGDLQRKSITPVTYGEHDYDTPVWSPDGRDLAFDADLRGAPHVCTRPAGGGTTRELVPPGDIQYVTDWLKDGRILFHATSAKTGDDLLIARGDGSAEVWRQTPANEHAARISPDQKWVAYGSDESGRNEVYVAALDHPGEPVRISNDGGNWPAWSRDGREVYWKIANSIMAAPVRISGGTADGGTPRMVYNATHEIEAFDVAPDGRLLVAARVSDAMAKPLTAIVNWKAEAERLLAKK